MRRILVNSRGATASRLIRSIREAGLEAVAIGNVPDMDAVHMREANFKVIFRDSWFEGDRLDVGRLVLAAREAGCDAVHPGCDAFAENARFAAEVLKAGLTWVGPDPRLIELVRDRTRIRHIVQQAGIPVVPGTPPLDEDGDVLRFAEMAGFPVVVKAVVDTRRPCLMRVESMEELPLCISEMRRRALKYTGEPRIYVERWISRARHIEVQVMGDRFGNLFVVGDREGTIQRVYTQVVEECPTPDLNPSLRESLYRASAVLAAGLEVRGAATVEFLVTADGRFYFLEMNLRLQDSHPVTEVAYGVDLVDAQVRVAQGDLLGWNQDDLRPDGHAIAFRIHAEDPSRGFQPTSGVVRELHVPPVARADLGIAVGSRVAIGDDTFLARLVVHGPMRQAAIVLARAALTSMRVEGVGTTLELHRRITASEAFWRGGVDTDFLKREFGV